MNEAHSDPDLPHIYTNLNEDPFNNNVDNRPNGPNDHNSNETGNTNEDDGDVDGPTVEACVELSKTACKYGLTCICYALH